MKHISALFFLCAFCASAAPAADVMHTEYACRRYTTEDGLPGMTVECVRQDGDGFIWTGGSTGLARFDGFGFRSYTEGRTPNIVLLTTDEDGRIMALSHKYIYTPDERTDSMRRRPVPDGYGMTQRLSGALPPGYSIFYIDGYERKALFAIRDTAMVAAAHHPDLDALEDLHKAYYDPAENLLYLPGNEGISVIRDSVRTAFYPGVRARAFVRYEGALWAVAQDGFYRLDGGKFVRVTPYEIDEWTGFVSACDDGRGGILFRDFNTLYRYSGGLVEKIFTANAIRDFLVDAEGNIWVATYQGLYNLFRLNFRNYTLADPDDVVRCAVWDPAGKRILAGSLNGELVEIRDGAISGLSYPANPYGAAFFDTYPAAVGGAVYLPGPGDLLEVRGGRARWMGLPLYDPYTSVTPLPGGGLVTGGQDLFYRIDGNGKIMGEYDSDMLGQSVYARPCVDAGGRLWWGGGKGVTVTDGESIVTRITDAQAALCLVMNADDRGRVWLASENRLLRQRGDTVELVREFPSQLTNIHFTRSGLMLVGTLRGLFIFDKEMEHYAFCDHQNGYTGIEPMKAAAAEDDEGNLWLPSSSGLVRFDPGQLLYEQPAPRLHLLGVWSSRDNIAWQKEGPAALRLGHRQRNLRFEYIGLSYSAAQNVRYRYRLDGLQDEWSQPTASREVSFNNLAPGRYTFRLTADAGVEGTQTGEIAATVEIRPALWQTWWFRIAAAVLLLAGFTWTVSRYVSRRHAARVAAADREREMNELRVQSVRLRSIPHFNANVLAGIEYVVMQQSREEANRLLSLYSAFTNRTLQEIDRPCRTLREEADYVRLYLELEKMRYGDKLSYLIEIDPAADHDAMIPNMVLHTYAENAVKHGIRGKKTPGCVTVRARAQDGGVLLTVGDDGIGREAARRRDPDRKGHGLTILSRQIELYNQQNKGRIVQTVTDLADDEGRPCGTLVELFVPYGYKYM